MDQDGMGEIMLTGYLGKVSGKIIDIFGYGSPAFTPQRAGHPGDDPAMRVAIPAGVEGHSLTGRGHVGKHRK